MHSWGDDFKYFKEVDVAARYIGAFCKKWGRIPVTNYKEKYGTVRVYCNFYCDDLHTLLFPGWGYVRGPYKLMTFPLFRWARPIVLFWQHFIYRLAYKLAIKKYPMIKEEILCCADWNEYLKGL